MARLDRLGEVKELGPAWAYCFGREFPFDLLERVAGCGRSEPLSVAPNSLNTLVESGLVSRSVSPSNATSFQARAPWFRTPPTTRCSRPREVVMELHAARIADVIENDFGDRVAKTPEWLAHHLTQERGGTLAKAIPLWRKAGTSAVGRVAMKEAVAHFQKGLTLIEQLSPSEERDGLGFIEFANRSTRHGPRSPRLGCSRSGRECGGHSPTGGKPGQCSEPVAGDVVGLDEHHHARPHTADSLQWSSVERLLAGRQRTRRSLCLSTCRSLGMPLRWCTIFSMVASLVASWSHTPEEFEQVHALHDQHIHVRGGFNLPGHECKPPRCAYRCPLIMGYIYIYVHPTRPCLCVHHSSLSSFLVRRLHSQRMDTTTCLNAKPTTQRQPKKSSSTQGPTTVNRGEPPATALRPRGWKPAAPVPERARKRRCSSSATPRSATATSSPSSTPRRALVSRRSASSPWACATRPRGKGGN